MVQQAWIFDLSPWNDFLVQNSEIEGSNSLSSSENTTQIFKKVFSKVSNGVPVSWAMIYLYNRHLLTQRDEKICFGL